MVVDTDEGVVSLDLELHDLGIVDEHTKIDNEPIDRWNRLRNFCKSLRTSSASNRVNRNSRLNGNDMTDGTADPINSPANQNTYAANKNIAEGLMDIALLSANANQLRFLITYNQQATFYYISLTLVILSLILQLAVGFVLILRLRWRLTTNADGHNAAPQANTPEWTTTFVISGVYLVTAVNVMLAALTTTDDQRISKSP